MYENVPLTVLEGWLVLIVDDDPMSRELMADILSGYGAQVVEAINGKEGLEQARVHYPKFIISDINMPIMDGWAFVEQLGREPGLREIPVIALTGNRVDGDSGDRQKAFSKGFHNYLKKPFTARSFLSQVLTLLDDVPSLADELHNRMDGK